MHMRTRTQLHKPVCLTTQVGVTNFDVPRLEAMNKAGVVIASNQVRPRPLLHTHAPAKPNNCVAASQLM
jgi:diketogulonate reductase-like aldo/keto reductase